MNPPPQASSTDGAGDTPISRRSVLAASGVAVFGGLTGCLGRVASAVTETGASPAAVFAGDGGEGRLELTEPRVVRLTPTISSEVGGMSGEVELEGWVTATSVMATDYNSSRSNTRSTVSNSDSDGDGVEDGTAEARANYNNTRSNRSTVRPPDIVDDDLDKGDETFQAVLRLDTRLKEATAAAWAAISKRSARTGRNPELDTEVSETLGDVDAALAELRAELERCSSESCVAALGNVADREADLSRAKAHVEDEAWAAFGLGGDDDNDILRGEYFLPPATFDPADSYSVGEQAALYRYLDGDAVVAERCTVCLPDAEVPGGNGSIREAVTPQRFIDYVTGRVDGEGRVYSWGDADSDADGVGDCDDTDDDIRPGTVCGTTPHFVAALSGPVSTGGSLEVLRGDDGTVVVSNRTPPGRERVCESVGAVADDDPCGPGVWARTSLPSSGSGVSVFQVMVQPPECPHPFPALLYVQQCRNDDQLIYTGGWIIDDAALYETSSTMLTMMDSPLVVGISLGDLDGDGYGDAVERAASTRTKKRVVAGRSRRGARLDSGTVDGLIDAGVLTAGGKKGYDHYLRKRPGRTGETSGEPIVTHLALDAPVLHLVNAGEASNEVKFKAGAELSGQVN